MTVPATPTGRRLRRRTVVGLLAAVGVLTLVVGVIVAVTGALGRGTPASTVGTYLQDLARGDASAALSMGTVPAGDHQYLTDQVLAQQNAVGQLHDVTVLAVDTTGDSSTVVVQYHLRFAAGDEVVTDRVPVVRHDGRWALSAVAVRTVVALGQGNARATLAGTALTTRPVLLFPGAVPIRFDTPLLEVSASAAAVLFSSTGTTGASTQVTGTAAAEFGPVLDAAFRACLQATEEASLNCPQPTVDAPNRTVPNSARGTATVLPSAAASYIVATVPSGFLTAVTTATVTGSYQTLDFDNVIQTHTGRFTLQIQAQFDPLHPDRVTWL